MPQMTASTATALLDAAARFDDLVRSIHDPEAPAIGRWSALQTVAHVAVTSTFDAFCCRSDVHVPEGLEGVLSQAPGMRLSDIERLNALALERFFERDIERLADHIAQHAGLMAFVATADPERTTGWLGGVRLTMRTVAAHFLGELLLHGLDIARSQGVDWEIGDDEAHMTFEDGYMQILGAGAGLLASPRHRPVSAEFRPVGYAPVRIHVDPGEITITAPDGQAADVIFSGRASTMLQVMFERVNPMAVIASGRVKLGGRRPWRVLRFRRQLRMP